MIYVSVEWEWPAIRRCSSAPMPDDVLEAMFGEIVAPDDVYALAPTTSEQLVDACARVVEVVGRIRAEAGSASDAELTGWLHGLAGLADRLPTADHAVLTELDRRGACESFGYPTLARMLTGELRLRPGAAKTAVAAAQAGGVRVAFTGEILPPLRQHVAAAHSRWCHFS